MVENAVKKVLQSFKGLTEVQASALLEIVKSGEILSRNKINKLLNKKRICSGNAGYKIIESLVEKKVLFEKKDGFEPINTNLLVDECRTATELLGEEFEGIKLSSDWKITDPLNKSQILDDQIKIIHEIYKLKEAGFEIKLFYKDNDNKKSCWSLIKAQSKIKLQKGIYNCIVFKGEKDKINNSGVIILSKRQSKLQSGEEVFYGHYIFDDELVKIFERGV